MAEGAWVPAFDSLWDSRKTRRLARDVRGFTSSIDMADVAGAKFLRLMRWMRENAPSGDLGSVDRASIALAVGIARPTDKHDLQTSRGDAFYRALVDAEFISRDPRGHVKGWEDGPGRLVNKREEDRLRKEHDRTGHETVVPACPKCRRLSDGQQPETRGNTAPSSRPSAGRPTDIRRTAADRPMEVRTDRHYTTEQTEQGTPSPRSVDRKDDAKPEPPSPLMDAARVVLEEAEPAWRGALQNLLIAGVTSHAFVSFFKGTHLEGSSTVVCPNGFARDWISDHYAVQVSEVLGELATFVTEDEWKQQSVQKASEDVAEGEGGTPAARTDTPRPQEAPFPRERNADGEKKTPEVA